MAFVREKITTEEDKKIFNSFEFKNPLYNELINPGYWRIDRGRNAFMIGLGGGAQNEIPECYAFVWNNNVTLFSFHQEKRRNNAGQMERIWNILDFWAPKCLAEQGNELIDMIKEAFSDTMMLSEEKRRESIFIFNFESEPKFVLEGDDYKTRDILFGGYLEN